MLVSAVTIRNSKSHPSQRTVHFSNRKTWDMSWRLATLTVKNNNSPPPAKAADVNLWFKASKEDHPVVDKTQARKFRSRYVLSLVYLFWSPLFSCQDWFHTVIVGQGLRGHLGPALFCYVPSTKKKKKKRLWLFSEHRLAVAFHSAHDDTKSNPLLTILYCFIPNIPSLLKPLSARLVNLKVYN